MRSLTSLPPSLLSLLLSSTLLRLASADELQIDTTRLVTCSRPSKVGDTISVHYTGSLLSDGSVFDSSIPRGEPITFTLGAGQMIEGWDAGLQDMCPGEQRKLTIPYEMAYGEGGMPPVIPPKSTLVFETELVEIAGVKEEWISTVSAGSIMTETKTEESFSIATAPSTPPPGFDSTLQEEEDIDLGATPLPTSSSPSDNPSEPAQCRLLGPFALMVQGALGAVALLALVYKRWRETPKRPWLIFFFDVSKQVVGSALTHVLNLAMSMLASVDMVHAAQHTITNTPDEKIAQAGGEVEVEGGRLTPNPCSFYILNLGIDTTLGIPILYLLLRILHAAFLHTPLARPAESIKSGHYIPSPAAQDTYKLAPRPRTAWWLKQCLIYFLGLTGMKLCVLGMFGLLPWLPWVGDWALRWTEGSETLQIVFVMFIFPLAMNIVQYWIIDGLIMEKSASKKGEDGAGAYQRVDGEDDDDEDDEEGRHGAVVVERVDEVHGKDSGEDGVRAVSPLKEANATPIPSYEERAEASNSRGVSPQGGVSAAVDVDGERTNELRGRR